jgi:hypothetical protein
MLRTVRATRYVTPLREGGSLPAIIEAEDLGLYVLKFRGAGQGALALVAELVGGEIGRRLGLRIPELVFVEVSEDLGRNEPDEEIRDLLKASLGLNLALDYLPGSISFDPAAGDIASPEVASQVVWFDSFILNVDRTVRNPNLLWWHKSIYLIDHGAALYFHHNWATAKQVAASRFATIRQHVLLPWATEISEAYAEFLPALTREVLAEVVSLVPPAWLEPATPATYLDALLCRLETAPDFTKEAIRARNELV